MIQQPQENNLENQKNDSDFLLYWEKVNLINILDEKEKKRYKNYHESKCCYAGIIGNIIKSIIFISNNIAFVISALVLKINNHKGYKNYRDSIKLNLLSNYEKFWCDFGEYENGILISYFILDILALVFEIISLLIHKSIIKIEIGKISNILILINYLFDIFCFIYYSLFKYLIALSFVVVFITPLEVREYPTIFNVTIINTTNSNNTMKREKTPIENHFDEEIVINICYIIILFIILILNSSLDLLDNSIKYYLSLDYIDINQNIEKEEKIKTSKIFINKRYYNVKVKNKKMYLSLCIKQNKFNNLNNILFYILKKNIKYVPFKEVMIEGVTDDFVYMRLSNKAIEDQLSITDWEFPKYNDCYFNLNNLVLFLLLFLSYSFAFFKLHLSKDNNYKILLNYISEGIIEKPKYFNILKMYGNFEKRVADSRFTIYLISLIITILYTLKHMYFGGFIKYSYLIISYILSNIFIFLNVIYLILSFLLFLFSAMCHIIFDDLSRDDYMIRNKLLIQSILNFFNVFYFIFILVYSCKISIYLKKVLNDINENQTDIKLSKDLQYTYRDLDNNIYVLKEVKINNFPRILFSKHKCDDNNIINQIENHIKENQIKINMITNLKTDDNQIINNQNENAENITNKAEIKNNETQDIDIPVEYNNINNNIESGGDITTKKLN